MNKKIAFTLDESADAHKTTCHCEECRRHDEAISMEKSTQCIGIASLRLRSARNDMKKKSG